MKLVIAGSRTITDYATVKACVDQYVRDHGAVTEVVSGTAQGVDRLGEQWAVENGVPITYMPADWKTHGKSAGPIRNAQMARYADQACLVWDGTSSGTKSMETCMRLLHKPCVTYKREPTPVTNYTVYKGL